jgi:hypothetical protein
MEQLLRRFGCWMTKHRWRPLSTINIVPTCTLFDWPDDREPETECVCVRCGAIRSEAIAENKQGGSREQAE